MVFRWRGDADPTLILYLRVWCVLVCVPLSACARARVLGSVAVALASRAALRAAAARHVPGSWMARRPVREASLTPSRR